MMTITVILECYNKNRLVNGNGGGKNAKSGFR